VGRLGAQVSQPDCDCDADLGGFHSFACARYAMVEDNWKPSGPSEAIKALRHRPELPSERRAREEAAETEAVDDALPRLKALVVETKSLAERLETIVASMRDPANHFRKY